MSSIAIKRIQRELMETPKKEDPDKQFFIEPVNNNLCELKGYIVGPMDSPFEAGKFYLEVHIPETYPFNPPKVKFTTKIWHPNISSVTGAICLDILKDQWAAAMTLRTVLISIQALLAAPEPDDPQDAVVAKQYKQDPFIYRKTAKFWTFIFATDQKDSVMKAEFQDYEAKITKMMEVLSVDRSKALTYLSQWNWDLEVAMANNVS